MLEGRSGWVGSGVVWKDVEFGLCFGLALVMGVYPYWKWTVHRVRGIDNIGDVEHWRFSADS